jgi:hypothetical protein
MKRRRTLCAMAAILAGLLAFSTGALAERPPGVGGGNGGSHDSGNEPPDYGDLFVLYRSAIGVPILTEDDCQQPLASEPFDGCITIENNGHPLDGQCLIIPVDPATCAVVPDYALLTREVDFGRINEARSPESVFAAQLEDATIRLSTAGCVTLDPAGRLVASSLVDPDESVPGDEFVTYAPVDSPLQNLAMYRQLILSGTLGEEIPLHRGPLDAAASSLGAASDKAGSIGWDLPVYINEIMGLTAESAQTILDPKICIDVREEVMGVIQHVRKCFLDYSAYGYDRRANFEALPRPAYIVPDFGTEPEAGVFEYLHEFDDANQYFEIVHGYIMDAYIPLWLEPAEFGSDIEYNGMGLEAFAMAADDTRRLIEFMHTWPVPGEYETPVSCDVAADTFYDVSISDVSGLQVPTRMVAGTEGREGVVTVANAGPATATGVVRLARPDSDGNVIGPLYAMEGEVVTDTELFTAADDYSEEFVLPAGHSASWTFFFSMDYTTRITWTATAIAEHDVNHTNDEVTEVTVVIGSGGGGGGNH